MTATTQHILDFRSYITSGALKFDFLADITWRFLVEGLNVRIHGTSNLQSCSVSVGRGGALWSISIGF